jgi:hypothetical protein
LKERPLQRAVTIGVVVVVVVVVVVAFGWHLMEHDGPSVMVLSSQIRDCGLLNVL